MWERRETLREIWKQQFMRKVRNNTIVSAKVPDSPDHLILYVTGKCGARCEFCFYGNEINQKDPVTGQFYELTMGEITKISEDLGKLSQVAFTGGDPFLRTDLAEIAKIFWKNNKPEAIHIPTNGLPLALVKKTTTEILKALPCDLTIAMSLDSVGETYDKVRGVKGNFDSMMKMYDMLAELKKNYPKKLHLVVNTVITNTTYKTLPALIKHVRERMPALDYHDCDLVRGDPYSNSVMLPEFNKLATEVRDLMYENFSYWFGTKEGAALKKYEYDLKLETLQKKTQVLPCVAGETYMTISERGEVYFCELREPIGNIRKNTVKEIWKSERADKLRESIRNKECYCTHGCYMPLSILYNFLKNHKIFIKVLQYAYRRKMPLPVELVEEGQIDKVQFDGLVNIGDTSTLDVIPIQAESKGFWPGEKKGGENAKESNM